MPTRTRVRHSIIAVACHAALAAGVPAHATIFNWSNGDYVALGLPNPLAGGDVVDAAAGGNKTFSGAIVNNGRFNWLGTDTVMFVGAGSSLRNNGVFDFRADSWIRAFASGIVLDNAGTLSKTGGSGNLLVDATYINRSGATLNAGSGTIQYRVGGTLEAGSLFTGAGSHVFETTDTVTLSNNFTAASNNVRFNRGTFVSAGSERMDPRTNLTWSGGTLQGAWGNAAGRTLTAVDGFDKSVVGSFVNDGRLNWASTNTMSLNGTGTTLRNNGTLDFQSDSWIRAFASGIVLDNAGTLSKTGGSGNLLVDATYINRSGATLNAGSGTIQYRVGGTLEAGSLFTGAGSHVFETTDTVTLSNNFTAASNNVRFNRGTFVSAGSERMDPRTNLTWSGGTLQGAWGNAAGRTLTAVDGFDKSVVGSFVNDGRLNWASTNTMSLNGTGTTLRNNGTLDFQSDSWIRAFASGIVLDNAGTLSKTGGSGNLLVDATYINRSGATLNAGSGTIQYRVGGTLEAGSLFTGAGSHVFETTDTVTLSNNFTAASNNVRFNRGTFVSAGSERMDPRTNLTWSGGTLQGAWGNAAGRTLTAVDGFDKSVVGSFVNDGRLNWASTNTMSLNGTGTTLRNNGTLDFQSDSWIRAFAGGIVLDNAGLLTKSAGGGTLRIDSALTNTGVIESLAGRIVLPANWRNDGTLRGTAGFETNTLTNAGDIAPGVPATANAIATLTLTGALVETAAASLSFDVTGGGVSDLLDVSGAVTFAGKLRVSRSGSYTAQLGDTFRVVNFASFSGSLLDIEESGFGGGVEFTAVYSPTHLDIRVGAVPEPASWALLAGGLLGLRLARRRGAAAAA